MHLEWTQTTTQKVFPGLRIRMFTTVDIYVRSVILSEPSEYHTEKRPLSTQNKLVSTRSTDSLLIKKVKFTLEQATKAQKGE